jgi:crotonobetainyl-CoA:carnitine CoA-transferase CaiB-like acyl-CoA transferase
MAGENIFYGLKVVDLASFIADPSTAVILSDFGAEVVRVEPPRGGLWRTAHKLQRRRQAEDPYQWHLANTNKRVLTLDLDSPGALQVVERLVKWADVLIVDTPRPARKRLKLEYDDVAQRNPGLIYADVAGFRETGTAAYLPGLDITPAWVRNGLLSKTRATGAPTSPVARSGDNATGLGIYSAIVTALCRRERTGKGAYVTRSLLANDTWSASVSMQTVLCDAELGPHDVVDDPQLLSQVIPPEGELNSPISRSMQVHAVAKIPAKRAPAVGQHNQDMLDELGFGTAEIEILHATGTVRRLERAPWSLSHDQRSDRGRGAGFRATI